MMQKPSTKEVVGLGRELTAQHKDGHAFPIHLAVSEVRRDGEPTYIGLVRDITQQRAAEAEIARLAFIEQLTELPNRRGFEMLAGQALEEARREQQPLSAIVIDLDHFKTLNDTHGHMAGDVVLKGFANQLRASLRRSDIVCRWGGEEFIALLVLTRGEDAGQVAERLRQQAQRTRIPQGDLPVTLSGGLVLLGAGETLDTAIKRADTLLYRAKQNGRNRIEHEHPATPEAAG